MFLPVQMLCDTLFLNNSNLYDKHMNTSILQSSTSKHASIKPTSPAVNISSANRNDSEKLMQVLIYYI